MPLAIAIAVVYLLAGQHVGQDLAAQTFRADLFAAHGFQAWSNAWYDGVPLPGYSLLFPPLGAIVGVELLGAASLIASTWIFSRLVRPHFGPGSWWSIWLFAIGGATNLVVGRFTFSLGLTVALLALLAVDRNRLGAACLSALATSAASPIAGLFLAIAGAAYWLQHNRPAGAALVAPALALIAIMSLGFPTTGSEPFPLADLLWVLFAVGITLVVIGRRVALIRNGALLYLAMCIGLFIVGTLVGSNATRLASVFAPALIALELPRARHGWLVGLAIVPLVYWQLQSPIRDLIDGVGDASTERSYYQPLVAELDRVAPEAPFRVEVPPTHNRWEAAYVAPHYPLARGWLRQLESSDFTLFRGGNLTADSYRAWLDRHAVAFVAVPFADAPPDYLAFDELALIDHGLPYLSEIWSNEHWRLYRVTRPAALADQPAKATDLSSHALRLSAPRAGDYDVRVSSSRWWRVVEGAGCASTDGTELRVHFDKPGSISLENELSLAGVLGGRGRC